MTEAALGAVLADPTVLWHEVEQRWFAYGTSPTRSGGKGEAPFRGFSSADLENWQVGESWPDFGEAHWSLAAAYDAGTYYYYASVGRSDGWGHQLEVFTSDAPLGEPTRTGTVLDPAEPFSIDARPWRDPRDGQWYLYYCKDFLEGDFPGTGIVVDRMTTMSQLAGEKAVVARPSEEWMVYERDRDWYDRTWPAWYTMEGASVTRVGDRIILLASAGNWQNVDGQNEYGIVWLHAPDPMGPFEMGGTILRDSPNLRGPGRLTFVDTFGVGADEQRDTSETREVLVSGHAWYGEGAERGRRPFLTPLRIEQGVPQPLEPSAISPLMLPYPAHEAPRGVTPATQGSSAAPARSPAHLRNGSDQGDLAAGGRSA